jgi:hypothetical protein
MKKRIVLSFFVLFATLHLWAQDEGKEAPKKGFQREKMFLGGNFGLTFGNYTFVNISPQLGYHFTNFFAAGMGVNAQYVSFKSWDYAGSRFKQKQTVLGLNVFGRVYPIRNILLQAQPEVNYIFGKQIFYGPPKQEYKLDAAIVPSLLVGGGLALPSGRGELLITIFYDVLQNENSPYGPRPVFNFGYNVGF